MIITIPSIGQIVDFAVKNIHADIVPAEVYMGHFDDAGILTGIVGRTHRVFDIAEVKHLYVLPEYMGKGVGRELLCSMIRELRNVLVATVRLDNNTGLRLFSRCGFCIQKYIPSPYSNNRLYVLLREADVIL